MIKNERQYRITNAQAKRFSKTLGSLRQRAAIPSGTHPLIAKAQIEAIESQLTDLEHELREYELLRSGDFQLPELDFIAHLPAVLIKARIARGLSQRDLAQRVGLKEQQIQRYEATDYSSANLARILEVAKALDPLTGDIWENQSTRQ
ncbi:MAG: helix-turn-helix transcriptional regulator [Chloroflexi bacterium]|nr:helix-turn-helix transcriptional regulator [Chloroflexota bacterium]